MTTEEIREAFLRYFEAHDHKRLPSGSLVPSAYDPSVLLTTAGMHPLVPYFKGEEKPPHPRLTTCQKCFRTTDIENVGNTARHLTFFEMLGNFSVGDYFKPQAVEWAWELSLEGFGFKPEDIWISVFEGDGELGLGPDEEAIDAWLSVGVPRERIVMLPRSENFWQAGTSGPCGPCSELYLDRGLAFGTEDDLPGGDNERFLEYWNLVFTQYDLGSDAEGRPTLTPLPASNIDTGLGLERMAVVQQGVETVFETDTFAPLMALGRELSTKHPDERALRILADHSRAMTFLIADGVVPSNEDRGYILRRIMRRAIQHGRTLGVEPGFLPAFADRVTELMGSEYPELHRERDAIRTWAESEEAGFGHTLDQGLGLLEDVIARARERGDEGIAAQDAFLLHDTFGFPFDLTLELVAEHGLGVDEHGFEALMDAQRERARQGIARNIDDGRVRERVRVFADGAGFETDFVGYERTEQATTVGAVMVEDGRVVAKLAESPFYAAGGGQVSDAGEVLCAGGDCRARVEEVFRLGDDQAVALAVQEGSLEPGERVVARVDRAARHATECNHTATHLLHAALRERLGGHVRQAGSYVGPDKLRFDFTHGSALTPEERRDVEDRVNEWILSNQRVRALETTLAEARSLGAMALFGEKYGDVVRMVEVGDGDFSRELCGGTHVRSTAEIGLFRLLSEGSSAANVRRIEAITGPEAIVLVRRHDGLLGEVAARLRTRPEHVLEAVGGLEGRLREAQSAARGSNGGPGAVDLEELLARAVDVDGAMVLAEAVEAVDEKALLALVDKLKGRLGDAAVVLGSRVGGRALLVAEVTPSLVARGVKAGQVIKEAARVVGGGGGGRDTMARAGGRDPSRLEDAMAAARTAIERALR
ncbi:MAG: alanine--tRNA ligase [Actinomycetota bacterium]|nr:alanine--tRNA ligase [Actinomycetota bacterium]